MKLVRSSALLVVTLALLGVGAPYGRMGPVSAYLMANRQSEISLARSAAPSAIALHATVLILGRHGYETAIKGSNGFTCLVERSWMSPFDAVGFWNWKIRGPICYNPPASRTILPYTLRRTKLVLSGLTKSQMLIRVRAAAAAGALPTPEPGSMSYMMSKHQYLSDSGHAWHPHLMFYAPKADSANKGANWGANLPGSPVLLNTSRRIVPEPETIYMIPVAHWSDGSPGPHL